MSSSLADQYYLQALEHYPFNPKEVIIALGYALSYDEDHPQAHCLMGRLLMESVKDYPRAAHHFEVSLLHGPDYVETYKYYSLLLIWLGRYDRAEAVIRRGLKVPGMHRAQLKYHRVLLYELQGRIEHAMAMLKITILTDTTSEGQQFLENEMKRLKKKAGASRWQKSTCKSA